MKVILNYGLIPELSIATQISFFLNITFACKTDLYGFFKNKYCNCLFHSDEGNLTVLLYYFKKYDRSWLEHKKEANLGEQRRSSSEIKQKKILFFSAISAELICAAN